MFGKTKQSDQFFELFRESMGKIREAAVMLQELLMDYTDVQSKTARIKQKEVECDIQTHKFIKTLNAAFITPFDRDDIFQIVKEMDNIVDAIEEVANRLVIFKVTALRPEAPVMAGLIASCAAELDKLFSQLETMGKNDFLHDQIVEINRLENEGDAVNRGALARLFDEEKDAIEIIKWKQIFELLEAAIDICEEVANMVEGLIMKHSQ